MQQSGIDVAELAGYCKVDSDVVLAWLGGEAQPNKTQFGALTRTFKRAPAFFFLPQPPIEASVPTAFRRPPGQHREATRSELDAVRRARHLQQIARWTAEEVGDDSWSRDPAPKADNRSPEAAASLALEWMDWSTEEQRAAKSPSAAVKLARERLQDRGVLALHLSIGKDGTRGFALVDPVKPLIAINTHWNPPARLFTYLHELGHLMRGSDAICVGYADTSVERWCERFAGAFLLPEDPFRERVETRTHGSNRVDDLDVVRLLARDFNVSISATALRVEHLGLGDGLFARVPREKDFERTPMRAETDNRRGPARMRELGEGFFNLLLAGENRGVLGRQEVLRYLDVSEPQLHAATDGAAGRPGRHLDAKALEG